MRGTRSIWTLAALVMSVASCGSIVAGHPVTLTGRWRAAGYQCLTEVAIHEVVDVVQTGRRVVATKAVGDACVGSGVRTFEGSVAGGHGQVDCWLGSPGLTPAIAVRNAPLTVVGPDKFTVAIGSDFVTYTRLATPAHAKSTLPWWPFILAVGLLAVALALRFGYRRRAARR